MGFIQDLNIPLKPSVALPLLAIISVWSSTLVTAMAEDYLLPDKTELGNIVHHIQRDLQSFFPPS